MVDQTDNQPEEQAATMEQAVNTPEQPAVDAGAAVKKDDATRSYREIEEPVQVNIRTLLDAGAHYGHQSSRWNPKMLPFIYAERNGIHIINLDQTLKCWEKARKYIVDRTSMGGNVLFVGTKQQCREIVQEEANRCGAFYVTSRWLGGTLTNFETLKGSISRMKKIEDLYNSSQDETTGVKLNKRERLGIARQLEKLELTLGGIRTMKKLPEVVFIMDINKDDIAVAESRKLHIPIIALIDTNVDPDAIDFPIPSNDDSMRALRLMAGAVADAVIEGKKIYESRVAKVEAVQAGGAFREPAYMRREVRTPVEGVS